MSLLPDPPDNPRSAHAVPPPFDSPLLPTPPQPTCRSCPFLAIPTALISSLRPTPHDIPIHPTASPAAPSRQSAPVPPSRPLTPPHPRPTFQPISAHHVPTSRTSPHLPNPGDRTCRPRPHRPDDPAPPTPTRIDMPPPSEPPQSTSPCAATPRRPRTRRSRPPLPDRPLPTTSVHSIPADSPGPLPSFGLRSSAWISTLTS